MDIYEIKKEIREFLIEKLTPNQTNYSYETPLSDGIKNYKLKQTFIPFSTCYRPSRDEAGTKIPVQLRLIKHGTPDSGVLVTLERGVTSITSFRISQDEIYGSSTLITKNFLITDYLTSKAEYKLVVSPEFSVSSINYISVNRIDKDTNYVLGTCYKAETGTSSWIPQSYDIYFKITTPGWIYTDYPRADLNIKSYPRLVVDITSRRTLEKWISSEYVEYEMTLQLTGYSEYLDELDEFLSKADQALYEFRTKFNTFNLYTPGSLTRPGIARQSLISRALISTIRKKQGVGEFDPEAFSPEFETGE